MVKSQKYFKSKLKPISCSLLPSTLYLLPYSSLSSSSLTHTNTHQFFLVLSYTISVTGIPKFTDIKFL